VLHLRIIILLVGDDVPINSDAFLVTDFVNIKIKLHQSFKCALRNRVCMRMFIGVSARIFVFIVFFKKETNYVLS
jgi:hypothetical protein